MQIKLLFFFCQVAFWLTAFAGCQNQGVVRPDYLQPFVPLSVEFVRLREDREVEEIITKRLFCRDCLFQRSEEAVSRYRLKINYDRRMDLKSLGLVFLSAALGPIKAEFTYYLGVQVLKDNTVIGEFEYLRLTKENTDSAFGAIFNPFHKSNGRSAEIFAELIDEFLQEALRDSPLPRRKTQL